MPGWCADAGFGPFVAGAGAGTGNTITRMRFAAATETVRLDSYNRGVARGTREETREELKGVVGRMMWEECWGVFCVGGEGGGARRWWEDRGVMEECVGMGTVWEVLVVEAGKES